MEQPTQGAVEAVFKETQQAEPAAVVVQESLLSRMRRHSRIWHRLLLD
jgi:hypothetical protein